MVAILSGAGGGANGSGGGVPGGLGAGLGGLGAGLPGGGLLSILALLGDGDGGRRGRRRDRNGNDLATMMVLTTLMNQMVSYEIIFFSVFV